MNMLTIEQIIKKYPILRKFMKNTLFVSEEEDNENRYSKSISINPNKFRENISISLVTKLIKDERYYDYVKSFFDGEINKFEIRGISDKSYVSDGISLNKVEIVDSIKVLVDNNIIILNEIEKLRFNQMQKQVTFNTFIEKNMRLAYLIDIDDKEIAIPIIKIINFLKLPQNFYDKCLDEEYLSNIKKEHFIYATIKLFEQEKILEKYYVPELIINRLNELKKYNIADVQAYNKINRTIDPNKDSVTIDDNLRKEILNGINNDYSKLEKSIYIYIKMCKLLVYDEEFYISGQTGISKEKHKELNNISNITKENNEVSCYEFTQIYAKLLDELNIKYLIMNLKKNGKYGEGHMSLAYRVDKFLINADAVSKILKGDLFNAKIGAPITGLKCTNISTKTNKEFEDALQRVYKYIKKEEYDTFEDIVKEYENITNVNSISLEEKISVLLEKSQGLNLANVDQLSYILYLENLIFSFKERKNKIRISIIQNRENINEMKPTIIITINRKNIDDNKEENVYIYYDLNCEPKRVSKEELQCMFDEKKLSYIENYKNYNHIPGIGEKLYDRRIKKN